jgi:hypothetical protein
MVPRVRFADPCRKETFVMKRTIASLAVLAVLATGAFAQTSDPYNTNNANNTNNASTTTTTTTTDNTLADPNATTTTTTTEADESLPATASPLPLLALNGLGMIATGAWLVRRRRHA